MEGYEEKIKNCEAIIASIEKRIGTGREKKETIYDHHGKVDKLSDKERIQELEKEIQRVRSNMKRKYAACDKCQYSQAAVYCGLCDEDVRTLNDIRVFCHGKKGNEVCFQESHLQTRS